jgi:hypothetical protein
MGYKRKKRINLLNYYINKKGSKKIYKKGGRVYIYNKKMKKTQN